MPVPRPRADSTLDLHRALRDAVVEHLEVARWTGDAVDAAGAEAARPAGAASEWLPGREPASWSWGDETQGEALARAEHIKRSKCTALHGATVQYAA